MDNGLHYKNNLFTLTSHQIAMKLFPQIANKGFLGGIGNNDIGI